MEPSTYYEKVGDGLKGHKALRAYRAAQRHLRSADPDYMDSCKRLQDKIIKLEVKNMNAIYQVQMVKGTDQTWDETCEPRVLLETADKQEALDFFATLPDTVELEDPETDLNGNEKYETPVVVEISCEGEKLIAEK